MNDLAQLECKKLVCVFLTSPDPSTIQRLRDFVTRLLGQLKIGAGLFSQEWRLALRGDLRRLCIDDIYINDIRSGLLLSVPDEW